jgi:phosphate:Na+ symporter
MIPTIVGGIGLFLLGMLLMTEGLKAIGGSALNRMLSKYTTRPVTGVILGASVTALLQSSSVTTLAILGFVSAGIVTFPKTLGLIFGTNLGTTSTAWIVSLVGLKINVTILALPLVGVGTFMKLFGERKVLHLGSVLAGFGLIFIGISTLQQGMVILAERYDASSFPGGTLWGNLLLVVVGITMTVVMQSSSAAVATTLAALFSSTINLEQAAVLVIGQNVGTTVTAFLAALGSSVAAKRAALAHILFNVFTGIVAFLFLPWLIVAMLFLRDSFSWNEASTIAAFHTTFNLIGLAIFLPFTNPYANLISRLLPENEPRLTRHLNPKLIRMYAPAIEAARRAALDVALVLIDLARDELSRSVKHRAVEGRLEIARLTLSETRRFLAGIRPESGDTLEQHRHASIYHAIDHLKQLEEALEEFENGHVAATVETCRDVYQNLMAGTKELKNLVNKGQLTEAAEMMGCKSQEIADQRRRQRLSVLEDTAGLLIDPDDALRELEAMRWMDRIAYHMWRSIYHLQQNGSLNKGIRIPGDTGEGRTILGGGGLDDFEDERLEVF